MSLFSTLRKKWRQHDEKLAERAHPDGDTGLLGANSDNSLASARASDRAVDRAIQSENAREHEEPQ
jgi:hypothetical protein